MVKIMTDYVQNDSREPSLPVSKQSHVCGARSTDGHWKIGLLISYYFDNILRMSRPYHSLLVITLRLIDCVMAAMVVH